LSGVVGRNVRRDIDHVAFGQAREIRGENLSFAVGADEIVEIGLDHRNVAGHEPRDGGLG